jgi:hypothetical protein
MLPTVEHREACSARLIVAEMRFQIVALHERELAGLVETAFRLR